MRSFNDLQEEVILLNKNGINFLIAGSICWLIISLIWYLPNPPIMKAYLTFYATVPMMPLAYLFSKLLDTKWKIKDNPLNGLGLWLNLAQLFYFPFVFLFLERNPVEMPMALALITGAHFFPFAWLYKTKGFAVMAGVIVIGSLFVGMGSTTPNPPFWIGLLMAGCLWVMCLWSYFDYRIVKSRSLQQDQQALSFRSSQHG